MSDDYYNDMYPAWDYHHKEKQEQEDVDPQSPFLRIMRENKIVFTWFIVILSTTTILIAYLIRYCFKRRLRAISAQQQTELVDAAKKKETLERNRQILSEVTMVVEDDHLEHEHSQDMDALEAGECTNSECSEDEANSLVLNIPGLRQTAGHCAICLGEYSPGDKVIWSPNRNCVHVFHDECVLSWLCEGKKNDCPCCRLIFIPDENLGEGDKESRTISNGHDSETDSEIFIEEDSRSMPSGGNE